MKRAIYCLLLVAILLAAFGASYFYNSSLIPAMSGPSESITIDSEGRFYMLNNDETRYHIIRVDKGTIDYSYSVDMNTKDYMLLFNGIFLDNDRKRIYTIKNILDNESNRFISSNIAYLDPQSKSKEPQTLYSFQFNENGEENQYVNYIYPDGDMLYFSTIDETLQKITLYSMDTTAAKPEVVFSYALSGNSLVKETLCRKDFMIIQTLDARITRVDANGAATALFPTMDSEGRRFPLNLSMVGADRLYYYGAYAHSIVEMDVKTGSILSNNQAGTQIYPGSTYTNNDVVDFAFYDKDNRAFLISGGTKDSAFPVILHKGDVQTLQNLKYSSSILMVRSLKTTLYILLIFAVVLAFVLLFYNLYRRRPTLLVKLVTFVFPVIIIAMFLFSRIAATIFDDSLTKERAALVKNVGGFVVQNIDLGLLKQINKPGDKLSPAHEQLLRSMSNIFDYSTYYTGDTDSLRLYCVLMKVENKTIYTAVSADMPCYVPLDRLYSDKSMALYREALDKKCVVSGTIHDVQGIWSVSIFPVFDEQGNVVAMLESGINSKDLDATLLGLSNMMLLAGLAVTLLVSLTFFVTLKSLLRPLKQLKEAVISVYNGNYGAQTLVKSKDEVSDIGRAFNKLSTELSTQFMKLKSLNEAYYRFVPPDTFSLLKKASILEVELGDQISAKMTVMNVFIRNYERLTADLSQEVTFGLINRLFKIISTNTAIHFGTIHTYNVDKAVALFQSGAETALQAVIGIRSELAKKSNAQFSERILKADAGFYIHTASCMYGIAGEENRYSPIVVSEDNDLLYSLDSIQHSLMCPILVTQNAYDELPDPSLYNHRYIGYVTGTGNQIQTGLYEFFDGDEHSVLLAKKQTQEAFNLAVSTYLEKDFYKARNLFAQILNTNSEDAVARWFLFKCDELCKYTDISSIDLSILKY